MTAPISRVGPRRRTGIVLRVLGVVALGVSAFVHIDIASSRPLVADGQITLMGLFMAQGVVAAIVALWVLVRGDTLAWLAVGAFGLASLAALVLSVYVEIPSIGPFPTIYEPVWYTDKYVAAAAAGAAAIIALVALVRMPRILNASDDGRDPREAGPSR